jgi:hypothetical protein
VQRIHRQGEYEAELKAEAGLDAGLLSFSRLYSPLY